MSLPNELSFLNSYVPDFDQFLSNGGQTFIPDVTQEQVTLLEKHLECDNRNRNVRLSFVRNVLYIKKPISPTEAVSHVFSSSIHDFNNAISGNGLFPVMNTFSSRQYLNGGFDFFEADCSAKVERIDHQSANIVLETCFRNENYTEFFEYLRSFLLETDKVMVVIGIIILEPHTLEMVPMVCVMYDRDHFFNPGTFHQPTILVSFGTISPYESSRNSIEDAAGPFESQYPMTGVGFSAILDDILTIGTAC